MQIAKEVNEEQEHTIVLAWKGKMNFWFDREMMHSFSTTDQHLLIVIKCLLKYNNTVRVISNIYNRRLT